MKGKHLSIECARDVAFPKINKEMEKKEMNEMEIERGKMSANNITRDFFVVCPFDL